MIDLSPELLAVIMLGGVLVGVLTGFPLAFMIGFVTLAVGVLAFGESIGRLMYDRVYSMLQSYTLLAIPLFVFMGNMLERSGIAERLYDAAYLWLGGMRGGLAITTILMGTLLAACVGVIGASVTMMAVIALPSMIKKGYSKRLASGTVCAAGTLGILIPPSIMLVIYGPMAQISVGKLFFAAFTPGFLLAALYCIYVAVHAAIKPRSAPPMPANERVASTKDKFAALFKSLLPTALLIMSVLGVIFLGIAPPTEAAGVGALASAVLAAAYGRLNWKTLQAAAMSTLQMSSFILLIGAMAFAFVGVFLGVGAGDVVKDLILASPGGRWGAFAAIMFIVFVLGFFIDWIGIVFIMVPIVTPIGLELGFDPLWFGLMVCLMLQTSFMTPPFAGAIFYCRGAAPPELNVTFSDIAHGVLPFVGLIVVCLFLCTIFPELILWLPGKMIA